jgi:membrane protein DedA with SNARE-associated domain
MDLPIQTVTALFLQYKYPALAVIAFFEGPYIMMVSGLLIKTGAIALVPAYIALFVGDFLSDTAWYYIGYFFGNQFVQRFGDFFDITPENVESMKRLFYTNKKKILMGSKLTAGFGFALATLMTAGMVKVPFGEYLFLNFLGQFVWTAMMLAVGYFFGNLYIVINNDIGRIFILGLAFFTLYLLLRLSRHFGRKAREALSE